MIGRPVRPPLGEDDVSPGCGDGDAVPAGVAFRCQVCDAEWEEDDGDDASDPQEMCGQCGEYHPVGVLDGELCPGCVDESE